MSKITIYLLVLLLFNGCCCQNWRYGDDKFFVFFKTFMDKDGSFYIKANYNFDELEDMFYLKRDKKSLHWREVSENLNINYVENIEFLKNRVIIKDGKGKIIYEEKIPTQDEISEQTGILFEDATVVYHTFKKKYSKWDRKRIIASVGSEKFQMDTVGIDSYKKVHNFILKKVGAEDWEIEHLNTIENSSDSSRTVEPFLGSPFNGLNDDFDYEFSPNRAMFCYEDDSKDYWKSSEYAKCFVEENDKIVLKRLYGEIYPKEYWSTILSYLNRYNLPITVAYFFDKNDNLNIFYNDIPASDGKYFNYAIFTPKQPKKPIYQEKIKRR